MAADYGWSASALGDVISFAVEVPEVKGMAEGCNESLTTTDKRRTRFRDVYIRLYILRYNFNLVNT